MTELSFHERALARAQKRRRGPECSIGILLRTWSPEEADSIRAALASPIDHTLIAETFTEDYKVNVNESTVGRHRRGKCSCAK